jgi:prepilin signal peptidase PulO-like enzyme (type II secretory pathway)
MTLEVSLIASWLFMLGLAIGSFLNVLIYRTMEGQSWVKGRSRCDHCQQQLAWYENIPLFSFLWLRGKSRCCQRSIPLSYPVVEFITGSLFVWWYVIGSVFFQLTQSPLSVLQPLFWLLVGVILIVIFFADLRYLIIPDLAVGSLLFITLIYRAYLVLVGVMQTQDLWLAWWGLVGSVLFFGGLWWFTKGKGMGFGDVKLIAPVALLLGWPKILVGIFLSFILGGIVATILLIFKKKTKGEVVPFGPFIVMGTVLGLVWGERIFNWYLQWL